MTDDLRELAMRAVESKHWRWMPGMRWAGFDRGGWEWHEDEFRLPDFSDAATLGCLLALVQEAHGALVWLAPETLVWLAPETEPDPLDDSEHVLADRLSWLVWVARDGDYIDVIGHGLTPAAALVAALEAAP